VLSRLLTPTLPRVCASPRAGVREGARRDAARLVGLSHWVSSPRGGESLALIRGDHLMKGREGAALMSPDGKNLPRGAREEQAPAQSRFKMEIPWSSLGSWKRRLRDGGCGKVLGAGLGELELQSFCIGQKCLLGALKRCLGGAGRVLPLVSWGLRRWDASQRTRYVRAIPGAVFLMVWSQSQDVRPGLLRFAAWLCRAQRDDGRGACFCPPPLLPGLSGSRVTLDPSLPLPASIPPSAPNSLVLGARLPWPHVCWGAAN